MACTHFRKMFGGRNDCRGCHPTLEDPTQSRTKGRMAKASRVSRGNLVVLGAPSYVLLPVEVELTAEQIRKIV